MLIHQPEALPPCAAICVLRALIVVPHVARQHYLVQQEPPMSLVRFTQHLFALRTKHLMHHIHQTTSELHESKRFQCVKQVAVIVRSALWDAFLRKNVIVISGFQHEIVVHHLPQPNAFTKQMAIDVYQKVHQIKLRCRDTKPSLIPVLKLCRSLFLNPPLQSSIGKRLF